MAVQRKESVNPGVGRAANAAVRAVGNRARSGNSSRSENTGGSPSSGGPRSGGKKPTSVRDLAGVLAQVGRGVFQQATGQQQGMGRSAGNPGRRNLPNSRPTRRETINPQYLAQLAARRQQMPGTWGGYDRNNGDINYDNPPLYDTGGYSGVPWDSTNFQDMQPQIDPMLQQMLMQQYQQSPQFWSPGAIQQRGSGF